MKKRVKWEDVFLTDEEYRALKRAYRRKDHIIHSPPKSLNTSSNLCYWEGLEPDGYGGMQHTDKTHLVISDDGILYVKWHKKQTRITWVKYAWRFVEFAIPVAISIIALIISLRQQQ